MAISALGLSALHEPPRSSGITPCYDIVLVHEFGGGAAQTWEPLRPKDAEWPNARVFTFGYNETSHHPYGREELLSHANRLLWALSRQRKEEDTRLRPIIFVGRGGGGVIIKTALVTARLDTRYRDIYFLTFGVAFYGMPHEATSDMSWEDIASAISRARLFNQDLEEESMIMDVLRPGDALGLTEVSAAFVRIPSLLLISDMEISPDVGIDTKVREYPLPGGADGSPTPQLLPEIIKLVQEEAPKAKKGGLSTEYYRALQLLRPHEIRREQAPTTPTPGTCTWIETRGPFEGWWHRRGARLLWIRGDMGCGKTYLARHIMRLVSDTPLLKAGERRRPETVAYCHLGDMAEEHKTVEGVLAWLLYDLLLARPELVPVAKLKGSRPVCDFAFYDVQQLWTSVMFEATKDGGYLTLVVDEIDALSAKGSIDDFLRCITGHDLPTVNSGRIRVLVLSRNQERVEAGLWGYNFSRYDITADDTTPDIARTTEEVLAAVKRYPKGAAIADDIEQQIKHGANGMYLWARLALSEAAKQLAPNNQQAAGSNQLTHGIFPLFDQYLKQFSDSSAKQAEEDKNLTKIILFWLSYQAEPMKDKELQLACALVGEAAEDVRDQTWFEVDMGDPGIHAFISRHRNMERAVLQNCAPLARVGPDKRIGAVHRSLQEYLRSPRPTGTSNSTLNHALYHCNPSHAHRNISLLCADYLLQPAFRDPGAAYEAGTGSTDYYRPGAELPDDRREAWLDKVEDRVLAHAFVRYAALFWIYHARAAGPPFDADLAKWSEPRHRRLLDVRGYGRGDGDGGGHALSWVEVWWVETRGEGGEGFPGPELDLGGYFPDEGRRLEEDGDGGGVGGGDAGGGWEDLAGEAVSGISGAAGSELATGAYAEELALARELEIGISGLMRWMGQLKTDVTVRMEKSERIIKDLQRLQALVVEGTLDPKVVNGMVTELEEKVEAAKRETDSARADAEKARVDADRARIEADHKDREYQELREKNQVMEKRMEVLRDAVRRSVDVLAEQKTSRSSWIPFRR
ncbi:hypothetical protein F5144DRAFT_627813 [Chaetomium tenue]|uniref:Uncharacterized protein n=1 Tax=Chaetomium tenue TaxID=1854479 RepID=A0ACB7PP90_9PEZI|nr:hypothetical protein F5144DRAFT_627813 [Chaetomium globosum]